MKEEYKEELKQITKLLNAKDKESKILGLSMFKTSKWVIDIKKLPNFNSLQIVDVIGDNYSDWECLDFFLEDIVDGDITRYCDECADMVSGLIYGMLKGITKIVTINVLNDF